MNKGKDYKNKDKNFLKHTKGTDLPRDYHKGGSEGKPETEEISKVSRFIADKSMRSMYKSSYSIKADPYTPENPTSTPYSILSGFNRVTGASYGGESNIDGGTVNAYNTSVSSKFLNAFDVIKAGIQLRYRYLPILSSDGFGSVLVDKMIGAIADATSVFTSETYTYQPFFDYAIETDLPMGSDAATRTIPAAFNDETVNIYTRTEDVIYATSIFYQTVNQSLLKSFNKFSHFRAYQGEMMRMSYDRETPKLNSLFSIFNKRAFLSKIDGLALSIEGAYIDKDWMYQVNIMNNLCSRRSESCTEPLMEISTSIAMPRKFKMYLIDRSGVGNPVIIAKVYDYEQQCQSLFGSNTYLPDLCQDWENLCSVYDTLRWARRPDSISATSRYNEAVAILDKFTAFADNFKKLFNDYKAVLDTLVRTGIVRWETDVMPKITNDINQSVSNFLIVNNIIQEAMSGCPRVGFNNESRRMRLYTLWNMYYGIPEYARFKGGAFIALSCKTLDSQELSDVYAYLPIGFEYGSINGNPGILVLNRLGDEAIIRSSNVVISTDKVLSRLAPLPSQSGYELKVPTLDGSTVTDTTNISQLISCLLKVFGYCKVQNNTYLDPDILAVYDYEIPDVTGESISYARYNGPFRGSKTDESNFGFFGITRV